MALKGKLVGEIQVKSSADLIHELFKSKPHEIKGVAPKHIQGFELHEGELGKSGSIVFWNYTSGGKAWTIKHVLEIDEEKKIIVFKTIDGEILQEYKSYIAILHITPESDDFDKATWTTEYEKINESVRFPTEELDFLLNMVKDIADHHATNNAQ